MSWSLGPEVMESVKWVRLDREGGKCHMIASLQLRIAEKQLEPHASGCSHNKRHLPQDGKLFHPEWKSVIQRWHLSSKVSNR